LRTYELADGNVLAATAGGAGDPPGFRLDDCATQRNLTDKGRAEARRLGEDAIALWLEEETIEDVNSWISISSLFNSWKLWSEAAGEYTGTQRRFSQNLESKGLVYERRHGGARGFRGRRWPV
jgi:phage/plasmid-associated DNA primase